MKKYEVANLGLISMIRAFDGLYTVDVNYEQEFLDQDKNKLKEIPTLELIAELEKREGVHFTTDSKTNVNVMVLDMAIINKNKGEF